MTDKTLLDYLPETIEKLTEQMEKDQERWGDTWKHRPVKENEEWDAQEERAFSRFIDYYSQWKYAGTPMPWLKIIGECHIAMTREAHPEELDNA